MGLLAVAVFKNERLPQHLLLGTMNYATQLQKEMAVYLCHTNAF